MYCVADFHQTGIVPTIHRLKSRPVEELEREILQWSDARKVTLLLPCLFSELSGPALPGIVEQLKHVPYLDSIIVPIGRASAEEFEEARRFFSVLPQKTILIWIEGQGVESLLADLGKAGLPTGEAGKGRACWLSMGSKRRMPPSSLS